MHLGRPRAAIRSFRRALKYFESQGHNQEVALLGTDLAEALICKGYFAEALELVRALTPRFEQLPDNERAWARWVDLCALILDGRRSQCRMHVLLVREALAPAGESALTLAETAWARISL